MSGKIIVFGGVVFALAAAAVFRIYTTPAPAAAQTAPGPDDPVMEAGTPPASLVKGPRSRREAAADQFDGYWLPPEGWTGVVDHTNDILGGPTINLLDSSVTGGLIIAGRLADPATPLPAKGTKVVMHGRFMTSRITPVGFRIDVEAVTFEVVK